MYNSEVKFALNIPWQYENISCKMFLLHYRESMVVYTRRVCLHIIISYYMKVYNYMYLLSSVVSCFKNIEKQLYNGPNNIKGNKHLLKDTEFFSQHKIKCQSSSPTILTFTLILLDHLFHLFIFYQCLLHVLLQFFYLVFVRWTITCNNNKYIYFTGS